MFRGGGGGGLSLALNNDDMMLLSFLFILVIFRFYDIVSTALFHFDSEYKTSAKIDLASFEEKVFASRKFSELNKYGSFSFPPPHTSFETLA